MDKKRERERNWTWEEKENLKDTLAPYIAVVDSKINNTNMISKKNEAWKKISEDLRAYGMEFPIGKLKAQWGRMKTNARSNISSYERELNVTGGGKEPKEPDGLDYAIQEIAPIDFEDDSADFDSDAHLVGPIPADKFEIKENYGDSKFRKAEEGAQLPPIKRQKIGLSEQLLQKRIDQIDIEVSQEAELFELKKKVQLRKLKLVNIKIEKEEKCQFEYLEQQQ